MDVLKKLSVCIVFASLAGCGDGGGNNADPPQGQKTKDDQLSSLINSRGLTGTPVASSIVPSINDPVAQLGKRLFFSKSLSGNRDAACVTCHHPQLGGGDNLSLPIGTEAVETDLLGPGRAHRADGEGFDGGPTVPRNAPTTFNVAFWNNILFHDGRVEKNADDTIRTPDAAFGTGDPNAGNNLVQAQARFPVTSKEEMKGFAHNTKDNQQIRDFIAQRLGGYGDGHANDPLGASNAYWLDKFRVAFAQPDASAETLITMQNISFAIGEYQRSQRFTTSPWQKYVQGDTSALSASAKNGALLFMNAKQQGGADCASCHSGDFFTDEGFHNIAMPQIGRGKGDGDGADKEEDFGRFRETQLDMDKFAFRTPSLLNVEMTGPWGHAGAHTSLEDVVRHHLQPQSALTNYDQGKLSQAGIQHLDKLQSNTQKALDHANFALSEQSLTDSDVTDLVNFLKSLTDPCTKDKACLTPWLLEGADDPDPNGDQLVPLGAGL